MSDQPQPPESFEGDVQQLAVFQQRHDALTNGYLDDEGVLRPSWDDMPVTSQEEYRKEAALSLRATIALGYCRPAVVRSGEDVDADAITTFAHRLRSLLVTDPTNRRLRALVISPVHETGRDQFCVETHDGHQIVVKVEAL